MWKWIGGLACLVALGLAALIVWFTSDATEGYYSPVFTADGRAVIAIRREARALVLGLGYESLTPPARVHVRADRFSIVRVDRSTGALSVLATLPPSPLEGHAHDGYRAMLYGAASGALRWRGTTLDYEVTVTEHRVPTSRAYAVRGTISTDSTARRDAPDWHESAANLSTDERSTLSGDDEVLSATGPNGIPCALVLLARDQQHVRTLVSSDACKPRNSDGVSAHPFQALSRRKEIERHSAAAAARQQFIEEARARGLNGVSAEMHAIHELERLGYSPRPPQLVARLLGTSDVHDRLAANQLAPLFEITHLEFLSGLFEDIRTAIATPGTEVDYRGPYILDQRFTTSAALNSFLASGGSLFFVKTDRGIAELRLLPRRPATR
jgi:hypothetical protein